jgi:hypothetical protein
MQALQALLFTYMARQDFEQLSDKAAPRIAQLFSHSTNTPQ